MADAGVAPVQHEVAPVLHEHLAVVQVVVLDRLRDAERRQLLAELGDPGHAPVEPRLGVDGHQQPLQLLGQRREPHVGHPQCEERVDVGGRGDLDAGVRREHVAPPVEAALGRDGRAQPLPRVGHQHPPALLVARQQRRHDVGAAAGEHLEEGGLVAQRLVVGLEPDVAARGRHPHHRRPLPDVRLGDLAVTDAPEVGEPRVDPRVRALQPYGVLPGGVHAVTVRRPPLSPLPIYGGQAPSGTGTPPPTRTRSPYRGTTAHQPSSSSIRAASVAAACGSPWTT